MRLGHIFVFGLAFVNFAFAFTQSRAATSAAVELRPRRGHSCRRGDDADRVFSQRVEKPFRHLFFIPVGGVLSGICGDFFP